MKGDGDGTVQESLAKMYQSATATCMCMMQWSWSDTFKAVRGLNRHMIVPREAHVQALMTLIRYMISTRDRGLVLAPKEIWSPKHKFTIHRRSDSDYATNPDDHRSISGGRVFVDNVPILFRSVTQKFVMLSVTEAKIAAGVIVAQDMLYIH